MLFRFDIAAIPNALFDCFRFFVVIVGTEVEVAVVVVEVVVLDAGVELVLVLEEVLVEGLEEVVVLLLVLEEVDELLLVLEEVVVLLLVVELELEFCSVMVSHDFFFRLFLVLTGLQNINFTKFVLTASPGFNFRAFLHLKRMPALRCSNHH